MTRLEEFASRLESADAGVRRVAVHDLLAEEGGIAVLIAHLPKERDEKAVLLIIRGFAARRERGAMPVLLGLYRDRGTSVRVAHAAILAHDAMVEG